MEKITFSFRIDKDLYEQIKKIADIEMRSVNAQCEYFLKGATFEYIEERYSNTVSEDNDDFNA